MFKFKLFPLVILSILVFNGICFAQAPNFGSAANFAFFSSGGAISNTGVSSVTGDIGTNSGAITGFTNGMVHGNLYSANNVSTQAKQDLLVAYYQLFNSITTNTTHDAVFGNGETITGGVYQLAAAGSIAGDLYLDAEGDSTKMFIFKIGGAFTTGALSTIHLINSASAGNIFWVAEGAIGLAASTSMAGTLIAHGAAYSMGAGCTLQGRAYSTLGAIAINNVNVTIPAGGKVVAGSCTNNPVITTQPQSAKICNGQPYTFNVTVTGANLTYQWRKDGEDIVGATSSSYSIATTSPAASGKYYVVIVGSCSPFVLSAIDTLYIAAPGFQLKSTAKFVIFSVCGAISNTGISKLSGNVGTNSGAISDIDTTTLEGKCFMADSTTLCCVKDLQNLYKQLSVIPATNTTHDAVFGNGETLLPGVYSIAAAASVNGILTLDGGGDSTKTFIFKIGGAFTTGASTTIKCINGAKSCNIFWVAEGAIGCAASTSMKGTMIANNAAISMAAGGLLDGRLFSTYGAAAIDNITATKPEDPELGTKWTGVVSSDWFTTCNWNTGLIPLDTTDITIPAGLSNYPQVTIGTAYAANIIIQKNASLSLNGGSLSLKGSISNSGNFNASSGTLLLTASTVQTLAANTFVNNTVQNLVLLNDVTLGGPLNVTGAISFAANNKIFNTGEFLTLKSSALATASISDLTNGGALTGNAVIGNVSTELYISCRRAWRLLSGQVCAPGPLTINAAWQEGSSSTNPAPGFGAQITGGSCANGFDAGINNNAAIKFYNCGNNCFSALPLCPGTNIPLTNNPGYFVFIRGDRSTNLSLGVNAPVTSTVLRVKGAVNSGNIQQTINAANYTLVGNPYLESVDFHTLTKNNVSDKFYVWDPKLNGVNGVGGYVTFIWNNISNAYDATSFLSPESQFIPMGAAFLVEAADGKSSGTLTFKEADKVALGSDKVFKKFGQYPKLRVELLAVNQDNSTALLDGVLTNFDNNYNSGVDKNDALKIFNLDENISIFRNDIDLAIERRKTIEAKDTSFLRVYNLKMMSYKLIVKTEALNEPGFTAFVKDNYLPANNYPINMDGATTVNFTVNADPASFSANRFSIIYNRIKIAPLAFITLNAVQQKNDIAIQWTTANELNLKSYEVEQSADKINFKKLAMVSAKANINGNGIYNWLDVDVKEGIRYYRIKSISMKGEIIYSSIVSPSKSKVLSGIFVIGNPIQDNKFKLQFSNIEKGVYELDMYTMDGKLVKKSSINYSGENTVQEFEIGKLLEAGKYQLVLFNRTLHVSTSFIKAN